MKEVGTLRELNLKAGETGTLSALNVQPGDVVEYVPTGKETTITHISGGKYYGSGNRPELPYLETDDFRIVSRANSGPVRMVPKVIPGQYGALDVYEAKAGYVGLSLNVPSISAPELRAVLSTMTQIVEALEDK